MRNIVILGSGNLAYALAVALKGAGLPPVQIFARNQTEGERLAALCGCAYGARAEELTKADLYIVAVSDMSVGGVSSSLDFGDGVVAHTAGSVDVGTLSAKIKNRGVIYPLQTFTKGRDVDFSVVPILIEATTPKALECIGEVARVLSKRVEQVDSQHRAMVHAAAVFAGNFSNYMYSVGEELVKGAGMDFSLLKPLILETAAKAADADSPVDVQTGPAVRNDYVTKSIHCELLSEQPALKSIYINLSNNIWEISKKTSQK